jgi:predicted histone-like DNA-binding protein
MALVNNPVMGINLRKNKNSKNAGYGKYYPEVDLQKTLTIRGFAQHLIDHGSKYNRGDIENIIYMITDCLPELVAQGIPVQLGDLGIFRPTCEAKASVMIIAAMEGLNPNEAVKAIHIRFIPNQTKLDNLAGPAFKDQCSLELRNIVDTEKVVVDGKEKTVTTLLPIATAVARLKAGSDSPATDPTNPSNGSETEGGQNGGSTLDPPTISGKTSFSDSTTVSLSGPDGADIYYTLDGSTPTAESTMYTEEFGLSDTTTVKAVAILNGASSEVASKTFTKI